MAKTFAEALDFAKRHGMKVEFNDETARVIVAYPSGEAHSIPNDEKAPQRIIELTCRMI